MVSIIPTQVRPYVNDGTIIWLHSVKPFTYTIVNITILVPKDVVSCRSFTLHCKELTLSTVSFLHNLE